MKGKIDPQKVVDNARAVREAATAMAARQAIGDAVLILLRTQALTRESLREQLLRMADGETKEWDGVPNAARRAAEFILDPPAELPAWPGK